MNEVTEDSLIVVGRRGRPRSRESKSALSTRVPDRHYDTLVKMACELDVSVCQLTRDILVKVAERHGGRYGRTS